MKDGFLRDDVAFYRQLLAQGLDPDEAEHRMARFFTDDSGALFARYRARIARRVAEARPEGEDKA